MFKNEDYEKFEQHVEDKLVNFIYDFDNTYITDRKILSLL